MSICPSVSLGASVCLFILLVSSLSVSCLPSCLYSACSVTSTGFHEHDHVSDCLSFVLPVSHFIFYIRVTLTVPPEEIWALALLLLDVVSVVVLKAKSWPCALQHKDLCVFGSTLASLPVSSMILPCFIVQTVVAR